MGDYGRDSFTSDMFVEELNNTGNFADLGHGDNMKFGRGGSFDGRR